MITPLPTPPSTANPATFDSLADAFIDALPTFVTEANELADTVNTQSASVAAAAPGAVAAANFKGEYAAGTTYQIGHSASYGGDTWYAKTINTGVTPALGANWQRVIAIPSQTGNAGKVLGTDGSAVSWTYAQIHNVVTATTDTTLTATPTVLVMTPTAYGVTIKLPDATTCDLGGPLHIIHNQGNYPVVIRNTSGLLLGFLLPGEKTEVFAEDISTAAGVWGIANLELVSVSVSAGSGALSLFNTHPTQCVDMGDGKEVLFSNNGSGYPVAMVYDRLTNTFGSEVAIRAVSASFATTLVNSTTVLICSCAVGATALEAVALTVSGTTITVNTPATATLSNPLYVLGSIDSTDGKLIEVNGSFILVCRINTTIVTQFRAITVVGTTVTIGAATVLSSPNAVGYNSLGPLAINVGGTLVVGTAIAGTAAYASLYTVSGTTITFRNTLTYAGTSASVRRMVPLGTRAVMCFTDAAANGAKAVLLTVTGTVLSGSVVTAHASSGAYISESIAISATKLFTVTSSGYVGIITDNGSGVASVGTLNVGDAVVPFMLSGTTVYAMGTTGSTVYVLACSGATPVNSGNVINRGTLGAYLSSASNPHGRRSNTALYSSNFMQPVKVITAAQPFALRYLDGVLSFQPNTLPLAVTPLPNSSGRVDSEVWALIQSPFTLVKLECVV